MLGSPVPDESVAIGEEEEVEEVGEKKSEIVARKDKYVCFYLFFWR